MRSHSNCVVMCVCVCAFVFVFVCVCCVCRSIAGWVDGLVDGFSREVVSAGALEAL